MRRSLTAVIPAFFAILAAFLISGGAVSARDRLYVSRSYNDQTGKKIIRITNTTSVKMQKYYVVTRSTKADGGSHVVMWNKPLPPPPRPVVALNPVPPPPFKSPGKWNPIPIQYWKQSAGRFFTVDLAKIILDEARKNDLDPLLIWAVIDQESGFNPAAVSPKGASGLMQLMPGTAEGLGVSDPFDPVENVRGGVQYLRAQVDRFKDLALALAAYNAGPGAVEEAGGIPGYEETQNYVEAILSRYNDLKGR